MSAKRGPYRKCYLVPHGRGFKYLRAIPKDLQAVEQKQAWVKYLGVVSRAEAETLAHALAHEHGRRILTLRGSPCSQTLLTFGRPGSSGLAGRVTEEAASGAPHIPAAIAPPRRGLMDLVLLWERVRRPRSQISRAKSRLCARRFVELVGNLPIDDIARAHAVAFRDGLEGSMKSKNVADHLGRLHVLFSVAMSEGLLEGNPFNNERPRHTAAFASRRQGFTAEHVGAIFEALKGEPSHFARDVPIHPACMAIRNQAETAARQDGGWLFPSLPVKRLGRGRWFQDYGSRFLRHTVGMPIPLAQATAT